MRRLLANIAVVLIFFATNPAMVNWWLVRKCLVVDIEPTDKDKNVTKIGKNVYQSSEQAEADAKQLCAEAKPRDRSAP
jgi:hypothetical protein